MAASASASVGADPPSTDATDTGALPDVPGERSDPEDAPRTVSEPIDDAATSQREVEDVEVSDGHLASLQEHHEVTAQEAELRFRLEEASTGLDRRLAERWPDEYAGSWMNPGDLEVTIAFTDVDDHDHRIEQLDDEFAYPEHVVIDDAADHAYEELRAAQDEMSDDGRDHHDGAEHPVEEMRSVAGGIGYGVDVRGNSVSLTVDETERDRLGDDGIASLQNAMREHYEFDNVTVREVGSVTHDCARTNCQWSMMAGLTLRWSNEACTSGFTTWRDGEHFTMSAAHCNGTWRLNGPDGHYGTVHTEQHGGLMDVELIRHHENPWSTQGWIYVDSDDIRVVDGYVSSTGYSYSWTIGMSGHGSAQTERGNILDMYWDGEIEGVWYDDLVVADYCRQGGDSGGPVFRNHTALGIHAAGAECTAWFSKIEYPLDHWELDLIVD